MFIFYLANWKDFLKKLLCEAFPSFRWKDFLKWAPTWDLTSDYKKLVQYFQACPMSIVWEKPAEQETKLTEQEENCWRGDKNLLNRINQNKLTNKRREKLLKRRKNLLNRWGLMALTTVGNGDKAPSTHVGKVIDVRPPIQLGFSSLSNHL